MPPLCFTTDELTRAVGALRAGLREICGEN
jgi:hypothetical protein